MEKESWLYRTPKEGEEEMPCHAVLRLIFGSKRKDIRLILEAASVEECFRQARLWANEKGAVAFEIKSLEEVTYSALGVRDYFFVPCCHEGQFDYEGSWYVQEYFLDIPIGDAFIFKIDNQNRRADDNVNGFWHSPYYIFGPAIGDAISLANILCIKRESSKYDLAIAVKKLRDLMDFKPGKETPLLVLARDLFGTFGLFFHEKKLREEFPKLWGKITSVLTQPILDCALVLDTESKITQNTKDHIVKQIYQEFEIEEEELVGTQIEEIKGEGGEFKWRR